MASRCLITGCGGFIGSHLAEYLSKKGLSVHGTVRRHRKSLKHLRDKITIWQCDLLNRQRVEDVMNEVKPDYVFHLASRSLVTLSWQDPEETMKVNILGTLHLLDSVREANIDPLIQVACSSAEYGTGARGRTPIAEDTPLEPSSPYGVSKAAQDRLAYLYWQAYKVKVIRTRPFRIAGPGRTQDVYSDFARGIAEIERGRSRVLQVGNLEAVRELVDVRDCVEAMWLLAREGTPGEVYNICSGRGHKMADIVKMLISLSPSKIEVLQQPGKLRPLDEPVVVGSNDRLRRLGWEPRIPLEKSLSDILEYWRAERSET